MKKTAVVLVLVAFAAGMGYASISREKPVKQQPMKEKKEKKEKNCSKYKTCLYG